MVNFAINHMTTARMSFRTLLAVASNLGCVGVEVRNDLSSGLFDGNSPETARQQVNQQGLRILGVSEVTAFNKLTDTMLDSANALMKTAVACGATAINLIPRNDGQGTSQQERRSNLIASMQTLKPLLESHQLIGMIEPLGFQQCSLRSKTEVVDAIESLDATRQFKLVHDTFHHHLAGETDLYPEYTGMVHISGVADSTVSTSEMQDEHRGLVDANDRLGTIDQIAALTRAGYSGPVSIEAFSRDVHAFTDPEEKISGSFNYIASTLAAHAA